MEYGTGTNGKWIQGNWYWSSWFAVNSKNSAWTGTYSRSFSTPWILASGPGDSNNSQLWAGATGDVRTNVGAFVAYVANSAKR
jgi:hypothetical protein